MLKIYSCYYVTGLPGDIGPQGTQGLPAAVGPQGEPGLCGPPGDAAKVGSVYTRWGGASCPGDAELLYQG